MSGAGTRRAAFIIEVELSAPDFLTHMNRWVADGAAWISGAQPGLQPLQEVSLEVRVSEQAVGSVSGRAVQVTPSGVGVEFSDRDAVLALTRAWSPEEHERAGTDGVQEEAKAQEEEREPVDSSQPEEEAPQEEGDQEQGGEGEPEEEEPKTDGMGSLYHRLKVLTVLEKKHLALRANKAERHMLSRDNNKGLHAFVLRNLKFPRYSVHAIRMIADTPEWVSNLMVQRNIICHPATPLEIARKLLSRMNENQIRMIQRTGRLNAILAKDAKQRIVRLREKGKRRR